MASVGVRGALLSTLLLAPRSALAEPDLDALDGYVEATMRADRIPGVAVAIVHDQAVVRVIGYGDDGYGRPVGPDTGFLLGSMSKSFTALAVLQLVEKKLIDLDAPAQRYLPWFRVADPGASSVITVRQLLHQTSGLPTRAPHAANDTPTLADQVRALAAVSLVSPPGTAHRYSSPNYLVLGAIVEQVTGTSYAEYVEEHVLRPLEMTGTFMDEQRAKAAGMARGHRYWFGRPIATTLRYEADRLPTSAIISSGRDLTHYMLAQLNGGRYGGRAILSTGGMAEMHRAEPPGGSKDGGGFTYAFGWRVGTVSGVPAVHHGGIVPHFRGKMVLLPDTRWGVAVLTNASTTFPLPIKPSSHRMADDIAGFLVGRPLVPARVGQHVQYLLASAGLAAVLLAQLTNLGRLRLWRARLSARTARSVRIGIALELAWPLVAVAGLPLLLGVPWREMLRGAPDLGWWLLVVAALGSATGLAQLRAYRRHLALERSRRSSAP